MNVKNLLEKINAGILIKKSKTFLKENKNLFITTLILILGVDIFFVPQSSDFVIFGLLIVYGIFVRTVHFKSRATFLLCLGLLFAMFLNYLFTSTSIATEKAAVWLVLFMAVGIFQQWRE